ncbi:MAG: TonB-dependent receptor plug domain-containing protein [Bacteroidales bacterium]|nr:TonB-dependent receptor plug domain-containing protein [Bacteroidales bacterium]
MHNHIKKRVPICFKRWKRTPWAPFASMGKTIKIGVLCVTYSLLVFKSQPLLSQSKTKSEDVTLRALEELVINTERPTPFQPLVRVVAVIRQQEIERAAVQNLQDLLRYIQGADLRSRGSEGVQADLNILGGTFDQTMVMINGINFSDPQTGHHSLNIPVDISQIERVELLHGPGAWSEGSVAYSGAINIITKRPEKTTLQSTLSGGEYGYFRGSANIGFSPQANRYKGWSLSGQAGGGHSRSDGFTDNTDFEITNLFSNISINNIRGHSIDIQAGWQEKSFGANSFYSIAYPEQFENTRVFLSSLKYVWENKSWQISASVYQRRHHDRFELFRDESPQWYKGHNYHVNDVVGINSKAAYRWKKWGSTVFGVDFRYEHIYSTVLGDPLDAPIAVPGETGVSFTKGKERDTYSLFLRHILQLDKWRFTAGIMGAENSNYGTRLYAGLAAAYSINPYLEASGWINNSYRNPTFTDLYYKSPTQTGNMGLKPEEAIAAQIGLRFTRFNLRSSVSGFYRYGYRIIDWTRESGSDQWSASNITNIRSAGIDISAMLLFASGPITRAAISYSWMDVSKQSEGLHSLYATDFLRHKAGVSIEHDIAWKLSGRWDLSYQKRDGTYLGAEGSEVPYKGFIIADLKIVWNGKIVKPFAEATNLFNTNYLHIGNLPQPRRWIKVGVGINI